MSATRRGDGSRPGTVWRTEAGPGLRICWLAPMVALWFAARLTAAPALTAGVARVRVDAAGLRNTNGVVRVALFATAAGFPDAGLDARFTATVPVTGACVTARFPRVPHGIYAVAVLHDENWNGRMDRRFPGLPREGFVVSGTGERQFRTTPRFHEAAIPIRAASTNLALRIRYY